MTVNLTLKSSVATAVFAVFAAFRQITPSLSLRRHDTDDAVDTREHLAALSGIN